MNLSSRPRETRQKTPIPARPSPQTTRPSFSGLRNLLQRVQGGIELAAFDFPGYFSEVRSMVPSVSQPLPAFAKQAIISVRASGHFIILINGRYTCRRVKGWERTLRPGMTSGIFRAYSAVENAQSGPLQVGKERGHLTLSQRSLTSPSHRTSISFCVATKRPVTEEMVEWATRRKR